MGKGKTTIILAVISIIILSAAVAFHRNLYHAIGEEVEGIRQELAAAKNEIQTLKETMAAARNEMQELKETLAAAEAKEEECSAAVRLPENPVYQMDYCVVPNQEESAFDFYCKAYSTELDGWETNVLIYSQIGNTVNAAGKGRAVFSEGCAVVTIEAVPYEKDNKVFVCFEYEKGPLRESMDLFTIKIKNRWEWDVLNCAKELKLNYKGWGFIVGEF